MQLGISHDVNKNRGWFLTRLKRKRFGIRWGGRGSGGEVREIALVTIIMLLWQLSPFQVDIQGQLR